VEGQEIVGRAWTELDPLVAEAGYELIEVEFGRHGASGLLRVFIDRPGGVTVDDCAAVSRVISALLDVRDFIESHYTLEVSSPGIARPIRREKDFKRFAGEPIRLTTVTPIEGRKRFNGVLRGIDDGLVGVEVNGTEYRIHVENVKQANLDR
jgi:ribosome maturation factor RimP